MELLEHITALSHEFGTSDYVHGGGGNTSVKDATTLWMKPSGTMLLDIQPKAFVGMDREMLSRLYEIEPPAESAGREKMIRELIDLAALADTPGRASVEAPLHDALSYRYVVHTHPAIVNGLTCSKEGKAVCARLFPHAIWLDYINPGYTLCMEVRRQIQLYKAMHGHEPFVIFLKNHGVFVAGDTPEDIRSLYEKMMSGLKGLYEKLRISTELKIEPLPDSEWIAEARAKIIEVIQAAEVSITESGLFKVAKGPVTPDHIVYSRSYPFEGELSEQAVRMFQIRNGYLPHVIVTERAIFGMATTPEKAALALELAQDGALVKQLTQAFGGIDYMSDDARQFIESWKVESYEVSRYNSL